ncbi:MAG: Maf family protein [Pyrinomonadaceae bacterium]
MKPDHKQKSISAILFQTPLILASASPRRAEILRSIGFDFRIHPVNIDETALDNEEPLDYVRRVAKAKAEAAAKIFPDLTVLGADTIVVIDGEILGKPRDIDDARSMIQKLGGKTHDVITSIALVRPGRSDILIAYELTRVRFALMSSEEIDWYLSTGESMDKAGGYGVQGYGKIFIEAIEGDYWNVVGLPVRLLIKCLAVRSTV